MSEDEIPNLSADLEEAWDEIEPAEENDDVTDQPIADATASGSVDAPVTGATDSNGGTADAVSDAVPEHQEQNLEGVTDAASESPPVGLSPAAREAWKDTPEAVRKDIAKREADYASGIEKHRNGSQRAAQMDQVLAPYAQYLAMSGGAAPTINTLLQTGASLQMGSQQQKAQIISDIIGQYGVDIRTLDNILVGKAPAPEQQQNDAVQSAVNQALAPYQNFMQQQQQGQQHEMQRQDQEITQTLDSFSVDPKNEFYKDVRMDMADLLDMAANRSQSMSLQQAYDKACKLNPEIEKIVNTRAATQSAGGKRRAATSISGGQGGTGAGGEGLDMRATIEDAWSQAGRT